MPVILTSSAVIVFIIISIVPFYYTNNVQPQPYMDEVFHIPQAKRFCDGNYSYWDPMITTLPGLYLSSLIMLKPIAILLPNIGDVCSTGRLRAVNIVFMAGNMLVIYFLIKKIHSHNKLISHLMMVLNASTLAFFPVLYFFTWMYYTDPGSVFFTLLMYALSLNGYNCFSSLSGVIAIMFRQTNIIWVLFVIGLSKGKQILRWMEQERKEVTRFSNIKAFLLFFNLVFKSIRYKPSQFFLLAGSILKATIWHLFVVLGFMSFVYLNGGIVVGDKSHHEASLNFPQIFYFLCVTLVFSIMHLASPSKVRFFFKFAFQSPVRVTLFVLLAYYVISNYTLVHEYLLADNRHYTFYVWSKIYRRHEYIKYGLIVVYLYSTISVSRLLETKDIFWKVTFIICLCACTIPQKLLEFRYFIIPYLIFRINIVVTSRVKLFIEFVLYTFINVLTVYMYIYKPFKWVNSVDMQRFMW